MLTLPFLVLEPDIPLTQPSAESMTHLSSLPSILWVPERQEVALCQRPSLLTCPPSSPSYCAQQSHFLCSASDPRVTMQVFLMTCVLSRIE